MSGTGDDGAGGASSDASERSRVCPRCGHAGEPGDAICRLCFTDLSNAPLARVEVAPRRPGRLRVALIAVAAVVLAFLAYRETIGRPALPDISSGVRQSTPAVARNDRTSDVTPRLDAPVAWRVPLPGALSASPVLDDERIYVPLKEARLVALSRSDGHEVWSIHVPGELKHSPVIAGDALYFGQFDGSAVAVDATTGRVRWTRSVGASIEARPLVADGALFVVADDTILALDAASGRELWSSGAGKGAVAPLAATVDGVAVATREQFLVFDRRTGATTYVLDALEVMGVAAHAGGVFDLTTRMLVAVDEDMHRPWWEPLRTLWWTLHVAGMAPAVPVPGHRWVVFNKPDPPAGGGQRPSWPDPYPLTFDRERVIVSFPRGTMRAHDLATGEVRWTREVGPVSSAPISTPAGLLFASGRTLVLLDPATGDPLARQEVAAQPLTDAVIAPGAILLASETELILLRQ